MADKSPTPVKEKENRKSRVCAKCSARLGSGDTHELCYRCLPPNHVVNDYKACEKCMALNPKSRLVRRKAVQYFLQHGAWPSPAKSSSSKVASPQRDKSPEPEVAPPVPDPEDPPEFITGDV